MITYATTFSGIGGWEIGLNACGWNLQWQCECEPFCQALLKERFGVPIYGDITTLVEANPPAVDVLIGSPPCQPFSVAGARRGTSDERHLYPSFLRTVGFLKPRWVLMEQVPAILSLDGGRAFGQYIGGLAALGYDLVWHCIPACAVGAMHIRDRVWIIAHANNQWELQQKGTFEEQRRRSRNKNKETSADSMCAGLSRRMSSGEIGEYGTNFKEGAGFAELHSEKLTFLNGLIEPFVGRGVHGLSNRAHRIKALGNAVVPQIPYLIGQAINEVESQPIPNK